MCFEWVRWIVAILLLKFLMEMIMSDVAFSTKYRPHKLADVVGQDVVVRILTNSFNQKQFHHAYILEGYVGSGKTTVARIMAAMENCDKGPTLEPCGECKNCKSIFVGKSLDVKEIDAASNRSIDDIRDLQEQIRFHPLECRVKYVVLDEAHSLTGIAAEAALKMIEEPPPNVRFILATTDPQLLKPTIHSRCIILSFKRINWLELFHHVCKVADAENILYDENALKLVAKTASGSARNVLQNLQTLASYAGQDKITVEYAQTVLGGVDDVILFGLIDDIVNTNVAGAMQRIDELVVRGRNAGKIIEGLQIHLRNLILCKVCTESVAQFGITDDEAKKYLHQANQAKPDVAAMMLDLLKEVKDAVMVNMDLQSYLIKFVIKSIIFMKKMSKPKT